MAVVFTTGRGMAAGRALLCTAVAGGVLAFDVLSAPGAASSVPYIALPLICIWATDEREVTVWTGVGLALAILGWFLIPHDPAAQHNILNRTMALVAIAATGLVVFQNRRVQRALLRMASRDSLTGLWNRRALEERLDDQRGRSDRHGECLAVCLIDLDGFKRVNDRFGHHEGDALLKRLADKLKQSVRRYETVARIGGDEFVVALEGLADADEAEQVAGRLLQAIQEAQAKLPYRVGASAGVAVFPLHARETEDLLRLADAAMYRAKARGGGVAMAGAHAGQDDVGAVAGTQARRSVGGSANG